MGLWDHLRNELIDIIEWLDDGRNTIVYRFERHDNEIKHGAKLVVREGQAAVFINEGQLADVFEPGTYTLETKNLPVLATLKGWKYGFDSPFKAEVYFVSTRRITDLKWGTKNPVMLRDPEFGPVRLRAFGTYEVKVDDPPTFIREVVGTDGRLTTDEITGQLRNHVVARFADVLGEARIPVLDLAANQDELGQFLTERIAPRFAEYGMELTTMLVENISLPPAVEEALDKRSSMGVIGNLQAYTQFQAAQAMEKAADNPGGGAADGMGLGMGFAMAQQLAGAMGGAGANAGAGGPAAAPPPLPQPATYWIAVNGQQTGPFDATALANEVRSGRLKPDSLVWTQGMAEWRAAKDVPDLATILGGSPPPLPPTPPPAP